MNQTNITVSRIRTQIGDAAMTLFRIENSAEDDNAQILHAHLYYECHILLTGQTTFHIRESDIPMQSRQMLIIPPNINHLPFSAEQNTDELVMGLTLEKCSGHSGAFSYFQTTLDAVSGKPLALDSSLYVRLLQFWYGFDGVQTDLRTFFRRQNDAQELLFALFDAVNGFRLPQAGYLQTPVGDPTVTMDIMVNSPQYSLKDIASILGYSYRHTARLIRKTYGCSLADIRQQFILSSAKIQLLAHPTKSVDAIAEQCGCSDTHMLIRIFRKCENMTPTEFRRAHLPASQTPPPNINSKGEASKPS